MKTYAGGGSGHSAWCRLFRPFGLGWESVFFLFVSSLCFVALFAFARQADARSAPARGGARARRPGGGGRGRGGGQVTQVGGGSVGLGSCGLCLHACWQRKSIGHLHTFAPSHLHTFTPPHTFRARPKHEILLTPPRPRPRFHWLVENGNNRDTGVSRCGSVSLRRAGDCFRIL